MKFSAYLWLVLQAFAFLSGCNADLLHEILTALEHAVDCTSCHALLIPLKGLALLGDDEFTATFTTICKTLNLQDDDVCDGILAQDGPILAHSIRNFGVFGKMATKFCNAALGLCQAPDVKKFTFPIPKPPPVNPQNFVSTGKAPFQVVHFSDVHIDRQYSVGADANCTKNICCRNFADHVGPVTQPAGPFGNQRCDSPADLGDSMFGGVAEFASAAKFSIFTGDVIDHAIWLVNRTDVTQGLQAWNSQMASKSGSPIYPSIGNHDASPANSFPRSTTKTTTDSQWVFDTQGADWKQWIDASAADQLVHTSGSYAVVVPDTNLRVISLNTQYWYRLNFWLYDSDSPAADPNGILAFMANQLQAAEDAGQRAWLTGHIPPGSPDFFHDQSNYYDQIVRRYKNTVAAQFFGHSHKDQFEIGYSDWSHRSAETADTIAFIAPSLTPTSGHPAFRVYDVDPDTFEVVDAKTYIADITNPNFQTSPTWALYYSARESYGPLVGGLGPTDALNPSFWHKLTEVFETNDEAFQLYNARLSRGIGVTACTGDCKTTTICGLRATRSESNCDVASPGFQFKRDEPHSKREHLDCEGGGFSSMFRNLYSDTSTGESAINAVYKDRIRQFISSREEL